MSQYEFWIDFTLKFLASIFPLIMYFAPKIFIHKYYNKYVFFLFKDLNVETKDPGSIVAYLYSSIIKIVSFVSFLSIVICSIFSLLSTTSYRTIQLLQPICIIASIVILISSLFVIFINLKKKFRVHNLINNFEILIVFLITLILFNSNVLFDMEFQLLW